MADIRLIATDMDGTFLTSEHAPSQETIAAVKAARGQGVRVCACSGRNRTELLEICETAGLDDMAIINNGAAVINYRTCEYLVHRRIDPYQVENIIRALLLDSKEHPGTNVTMSGGFESHVWMGSINERSLGRLDKNNKTGYPSEGFFVHDSFDEWIEATKDDVQVIRYNIDSVEHGPRIKKLLEPFCKVEITTAFVGRMEISPEGAGKGNCFSELATYYGLSVDNLMAIGDGPNDAEMLRAAGFGVAMGNSVPTTLEASDAVTDTVENEGFSKAIYRYVIDNQHKQG